VIRALGPTERAAKGTGPLDKLAVAIARKTGAKYCPTRLQRSSDGFDSILKEGVDPTGADRFVFDKSFLPARAGSWWWENPTRSADVRRHQGRGAGRAAEAEVKFFTLAWLGEHVRGAHLDSKYFSLARLSRQCSAQEEGREPVHPSPARDAKTRKGKNGAAKEPAKPSHVKAAKGRVTADASAAAPEPAGPREREDVLPGRGRRDRSARDSVHPQPELDRAAAIRSARQQRLYPPSVSRAGGAAGNARLTGQRTRAPPVRRTEEAKAKGPQGVINVPTAGLRPSPSLEAKPMKGAVRNNERVTILKRKASSSGPDWLQIETRSGTGRLGLGVGRSRTPQGR